MFKLFAILSKLATNLLKSNNFQPISGKIRCKLKRKQSSYQEAKLHRKYLKVATSDISVICTFLLFLVFAH